MTTAEVLLLCVCVALFAALTVVSGVHVSTALRIRRLKTNIESFIKNSSAPALSVKDDSFSLLENNVADLESLLLLERNSTAAAVRQNAEFISDVSHQLKTPLAGIRLYCELEQRECDSPHIKKQLELIEKMEKLIQNLLRLEKLKSESYVMDIKPESLAGIAFEVLEDFTALYPQMHFDVQGDALLRCDRSWMAEALGNIVKNSCEHTAADGCVSIDIQGDTGVVYIIIKDDAGGVSEDTLPLLFNRFYRSADSAPGSAGIGLAITKAVTERHHGTVSAQNGKTGLEITICLPVTDGKELV